MAGKDRKMRRSYRFGLAVIVGVVVLTGSAAKAFQIVVPMDAKVYADVGNYDSSDWSKGGKQW